LHHVESSSRLPTTAATAASASYPLFLLSGDLFLKLRRPREATGVHKDAMRARGMNFMVEVGVLCDERSISVMNVW
jgi:hypothetical protein